MPRCTTSLLARSVSVDPFTNTLTAVDIAESLSIGAAEIPSASEETPHFITPFSWVFLALFLRDDLSIPEEFTARSAILSPKGRVFPGPEHRMDLATATNSRSLTMIPSLPYTGNGVYRLRYEIFRNGAWLTVAECPVPVTVTAQADVKPAA